MIDVDQPLENADWIKAVGEPEPLVASAIPGRWEAVTADASEPDFDFEIALQIRFQQTHGYWSMEPLAQAKPYPADEWLEIQRLAAVVATQPTYPEAIVTRDRLVRRGMLP